MIGQIISHYRIISQIGEGGMGVVYLAEDVQLGRRVAIKVPNASSDEKYYRMRFLREARSVSAINHPHIAAVHDYGETDEGQPFIVMELVQGQPLSELLMASDLTLRRAVEIIADVADALAEAHRRGVIHRDIKPSNVMINERGKVKVLDFGLAKQLNDERYPLDPHSQSLLWTHTRSDVIIGTPLYLSPEQARGLPVDERSDLFTLGAVLYECIAGRPAFSGSNLIEIGAEVLKSTPPPPSHFNPRVPPELNRITMKALAKRPEDRYQTADEMMLDLRAVHERLPTGVAVPRTRRLSAQSGGYTASATRSALMTLSDNLRRPRVSIATVAAILLCFVLGTLGVIRWRRPSPHEAPPEAVAAYERGVGALRDGAYYRASVEFENAVRMDEKFALAHAGLAEALDELDYGDRSKDELLEVSRLVAEGSGLRPLQVLYLDALRATATHKFDIAVKTYQQIVELEPDKPQSYVDQGRAYEKNDDINRAIDSYIKATNLDPNYATAFLRLGILYGRKQNLASATPAFGKAEQLYQDSHNNEGRAEVFYQRGLLYNTTGNLADARSELERALQLSRSSLNRHQEIRTLAKLSTVAAYERKHEQAEKYARQAVELSQSVPIESLRASVLRDLGNVFIIGGEYAEGEKYFRQAFELAHRYNAKREEAAASLALGSALIQQGNTDDGLNYVKQARDFYKDRTYRKEEAQSWLLLGRAYRQKGEYQAALEATKEQLRLAAEVGDLSLRASSHVEVANVLAQLQDYPQAYHNFDQSHAIYKSLGNRLQISYSLLNCSIMLWRLGRYAEARALQSKVEQHAESAELKHKHLLAHAYVNDALMSLSRLDFAGAKKKSLMALEISNKEYFSAAVEANRALCLARILSGEKREGQKACNEALAIATDHLKDPWMIANAQLTSARAALENGDAETALAIALEVQESFARNGQLDSEWLACVLAGRASARLGDEDAARRHFARASSQLASLQQKWKPEDFNGYINRPDIQLERKVLAILPPAVR